MVTIRSRKFLKIFFHLRLTILLIWLGLQGAIHAGQEEDIAKITGYGNAPTTLKKVMSDYGFKQGKEQLAVLLLLKLNGISLPNNPLDDVEAANEWLRKNTHKLSRVGERWWSINTIKENELKKKSALVRLAAEWLGMRQDIRPELKVGDAFFAIIPGAREQRVRKRIQMLLDHVQVSKIKPACVILAPGDRKLNEDECPTIKDTKDRNEAFMCETLWKDLGSTLPHVVVNAPRRKLMPRATTEDNATAVAAYLKQSPAKKVVLYEEQPFSRRCRTIFSKILGVISVVELYSIPMPDEKKLFLYQDEIAGMVRFLYPYLKAHYNALKHQAQTK